MPVMVLNLYGDNAWPDLVDRKLTWLGNGAKPIQVAGMERGMASGKPSVAIRFDLPNGHVVVGETSLALFLTAADGLKARYGDPRT
jgi:hypothetical protein